MSKGYLWATNDWRNRAQSLKVNTPLIDSTSKLIYGASLVWHDTVLKEICESLETLKQYIQTRVVNTKDETQSSFVPIQTPASKLS